MSTLTKEQYEIVDGILYRLQPDGTLRIIPSKKDQQTLFQETHQGVFGGHLKDAKVHSELSKHYWWWECGLASLGDVEPALFVQHDTPVAGQSNRL